MHRSFLLCCTMRIVLSELADHVGFDLSTGLQSSPISTSKITSITQSLTGVKNYKFYGHSDDHVIAKEILSKSSNVKFYIEIIPNKVDSLSNGDIEALLSEWDDIRDSVEYIALGNEPIIYGNNFNILPSKLRQVYQYLRSRSGWNHVKVSIPFSQNIFESTWPVNKSTFKSQYKTALAEITNILRQYGGKFSANLYPFFVLPDPNNAGLLDYCLGNTGDDTGTYRGMIEAQYDATKYAMSDIGASDVGIMITETGWSSSSSSYWFATSSNAETYLQNTLGFMNNPSSILYGVKVYCFELFDENLKHGGDWEQHFGVYDLNDGLDLIMSGPLSSGTYSEIESFGGKCLDIHLDDYQKNGGKVQVWDCNGWDNQLWKYENGIIKSKGGKCLYIDLADFESKSNGALVQMVNV
eukprot:488790_1